MGVRVLGNILGIETSCDEAAAAVVADGRRLLSNVIASQTELHSPYGGVVPELASRQHVLQIVPVIHQAVEKAGLTLSDLDTVAVTNGPGLVGSLLVGVNAAKGLALSLGIPLLGVNHLEGHVYSAWLTGRDPEEDPGFPLVCLIASGGHTDLVLMQNHGSYLALGHTRDDAAGEAFDKAARILGLGFPGGPEIQSLAAKGSGGEKLPRAWLKGSSDFSFSGLKTAILHRAQALGLYPSESPDVTKAADLAAAFQESVVDVIATKTVEAAQAHRARGIILGGGVAANDLLRQTMQRRSPVPVIVPEPVLCTDNGAMIASCAYFRLERGERSGLGLDVDPSLELGRLT